MERKHRQKAVRFAAYTTEVNELAKSSELRIIKRQSNTFAAKAAPQLVGGSGRKDGAR